MRVDQAPIETPPVFAGDAFTIFGRIRHGSAMDVTLKAGEEEWSVPLDMEITKENSKFIPVFWAKHRIQDLEDGRRAKYGSQQSDRQKKLKEKQLTELGIKYNLITSMTSFVAVEEREEADKSTGEAQLRRVPIALTKGWGGQRSVPHGFPGSIYSPPGLYTATTYASAEGPTRGSSGKVLSYSFRGLPKNVGSQVRKIMAKDSIRRDFAAQGTKNFSLEPLDSEVRGIGFGDDIAELVPSNVNESFNLYQKGSLDTEEIHKALDI
ncbi:MAG: hypothetical protein GF334_06960, partial [Candidatus Altiarchaeales archaeon]|nr:hypothetical protein [Candidatus Altiarchaeales archaeon]